MISYIDDILRSETADNDVYYISENNTTTIIMSCYDTTNYLHIILELRYNDHDIRSYAQLNSMYKVCICKLCQQYNNCYIIKYNSDGYGDHMTSYFIQLCTDCMNELQNNIKMHKTTNKTILSYGDCANVYNNQHNYGQYNVRYLEIINKQSNYIKNNSRTNIYPCELCQNVFTSSMICDDCEHNCNYNYICNGSKKYILIYNILLPELRDLICQYLINCSIQYY